MKLQDREHKVTDLQLYTENDSVVYKYVRQPVQRELSRRHQAGTYTHDIAIIRFGEVVREGNRRYAQEFGCRKFSKVIEAEVAQNMADAWLEEMKLGNFEQVSAGCAGTDETTQLRCVADSANTQE